MEGRARLCGGGKAEFGFSGEIRRLRGARNRDEDERSLGFGSGARKIGKMLNSEADQKGCGTKTNLTIGI
ncbi:hypothetical protein E2562_002100 [Oryza meyeriana var. granulata]|uniref:Uncharacterized protein n=1 Tax=Oryza meyeriana var. granulata TaxID=110450 RepID=A0A6G1EDH5_9ORYZ|nr:hypothetical protein E2562_002100 [Oryza meyeriana var. granulata]